MMKEENFQYLMKLNKKWISIYIMTVIRHTKIIFAKKL